MNKYTMYIRVYQIAGVFQKMILKVVHLFYIMPFAKIIGPVEKIGLKVNFHRFFLI